jgi:hypothetical protein
LLIARRTLGAWILAAAATAAAGGFLRAQSAAPAPPLPSTDALVSAAAGYVARYQRAFLFLLADEVYGQTRTVDAAPAPESRTMRGELFLTYLEAERRWIAVHDFAEVDGQPVPDRADLRALIRQGAVRSVAPQLASRNARYNLGRVVRNFNEPTLALQIFSSDRRPRFRFSHERVTQDRGVRLVTLAFRERDRPTLVSSVRGGPVFSTGEADIEADTGRIRRIWMRFEDGPVEATLDTIFAEDAGLGLWVPGIFTERYRLEDDDHPETVVCEARYTNYRRFETSGRLDID